MFLYRASIKIDSLTDMADKKRVIHTIWKVSAAAKSCSRSSAPANARPC